MPVTAARSSSPGQALSFPTASGVPSKAERLLALGDNYRPNLKRVSTEQNRLGALLEARKELKQTLARPINAELVNTQDWTVEDLFPHSDTLHYDRSRDLYYDSAQVPLHVSQQTSASAMRDMGLHKHAPTLTVTAYESQRSPKLVKKTDHASRKQGLRGDFDEEEYAKKGAFSNLFTTHKARSPSTLISPPPTSRTTSSFTHGSESPFTPDKSTPGERERRFETFPFTFQTMPPMNPSRPLARPDDDVLQGAKKHIRRPPKGIRNWFDGFDISSDEEPYEAAPHRLLSPDPTPQELPGSEVVINSAPREVVVPPRHPARRINAVQLRNRDSSTLPHAASNSARSSGERASSHTSLPQKRASRGPSERAGTVQSLPVSEGETGKRASRPAPSRMATESVLSMTSSEAEDHIGSDPDTGYHRDAVVMVGKAAPVALHKVRPRQLTNQLGYQRDSHVGRKGSASTDLTASSMPVQLSSDTSLPPEIHKPITAQRTVNPDADSAGQYEMSAASSHYSSPQHTGSFSADQPADGPRMMEVTEEEMMLLELMRNQRAKRAAKEKQDVSKSHHGGLEPKATRQTRQHVGRSDETKLAPPERGNGVSVNSPHDQDALLATRRFSFLKNKDVDRELNINRFLAQQSPVPPALYDDIPESSSEHEDEQPGSATVQTAWERLREDEFNTQRLRDYHQGIRQSLTSTSAPELVKMSPAPSPEAQRSSSEDVRRLSHFRGQDDWAPAIPDRNPQRPFPLHSHFAFDPAPEHDTAVPPTPIEDVRQSYCPSLPASAPLSLPLPAPPVFKQESDDATTTDMSSQRESPRMVIANAFSRLPRPTTQVQSTPSFTAPPPARSFHEFKLSIPHRTNNHRHMGPIQALGFVQQQQEAEFDRHDTLTPDTEISRSFSVTSSSFNGPHIAPRAVSPISIRQPSAASFYPHHRTPTQAHAVSFAHEPIVKESTKPISPLLDARAKRASMMSMTSAGEDVLAAWAELGGGTLNVNVRG